MSFVSQINVRVRYAETDQMGYVYYGNYATYFEVARVESLRSIGLSYKSLEDQGILLPVREYSVKFIKPAFYDENLTIRTRIAKLEGTRIYFDYEIFNESDQLINTATTTLVFIDKKSGKPIAPPSELATKLRID